LSRGSWATVAITAGGGLLGGAEAYWFTRERKVSITRSTGNKNNNFQGTSYDINKLYKTQSDIWLNRAQVNSMKELIRYGGPGVVEPIPIRVHNNQALIVDGHHRLAAFSELGYDRVPIKYISENQISTLYGRTLADLLASMFRNG
jgi:hypothetical protein